MTNVIGPKNVASDKLFGLTADLVADGSARHARLQSGRRNFHWMLRELPDREDCAKNEKRVSDGFGGAAASLFRANEKSVCGFVFGIHKR